MLGDEPADKGSDRERECRDPRPDADRGPALARRKRRSDDRERRGVHQGSSDALQHACSDQHLPRAREAAEERRDGENDDPDDEDQPATVRVGELPAHEHERGERQGIAGDDPLQLGEVGVEVALDRGQSDVHDRVVEHDHEEAERDGREREPLSVVLCEDPSPHASSD